MMPDGFFTLDAGPAPLRVGSVPACGGCKLHATCRSPRMPPSGEGRRGILVIAEAPGKHEDLQNTQLVGPAGKLLRRELSAVGVDIDRDCWKINAVNCRPPKNRTPEDVEILACRPMLWKALRDYRPRVILVCGGVALKSLLVHRWPHSPLGGITRWRGWTVPDQEFRAWVCPVFHPSFVMRQDTSSVVEEVFRRDLSRAVEKADVEVSTAPDPKRSVECVYDIDTVELRLGAYRKKRLKDSSPVAFDFETTGLKPQLPKHRIISVAIADDPCTAWAFPFVPRLREPLAAFLRLPLPKIAANLKFEENWARAKLGTRVRGWAWDTMQAAHVLDNRRQISGLDFQAYVRFGILDYSSTVRPFLKSSGGANSFNTIEDAPIDRLLEYNGMDALLERRLAYIQAAELGVEL